MKLSPTMLDAIEYANEHGGKLIRYPGGFWCRDGLQGWTRGTVSFGTTTAEALVKRGVASYTKWQPRKKGNGSFPIEITITHLVRPS